MSLTYHRHWKSSNVVMASQATSSTFANTTTLHYHTAVDASGFTSGVFVTHHNAYTTASKLMPRLQVSVDGGTSYVTLCNLSQDTTYITSGAPYSKAVTFIADKIRLAVLVTTKTKAAYTCKATLKA